MEFTGERQIGKSLNEIEQLHKDRYKIALEHIKNMSRTTMNVLDVGCGIGYGSFILSEISNASIVSYDISEEAILYAKEHYNKDNIKYEVKDCSNSDFIKDNYDAIIAFEFLEHLYYCEAIEVLKGMIENSSLCIASIPINNESPFHKFILNEKEIENFYYSVINMIPNKQILKTYIQNNAYYICVIGDKQC